jgi:Flp pilus assembly protein TadB
VLPSTLWWAAGLAATAAALAIPTSTRWPAAESFRSSESLGSTKPTDGDDAGWMRRGRGLWSLLAGLAGATFVSGSWGIPAGAAVAAGVWIWIGRTEPAHLRRRREAAARELPGLVHLLATALESGCDVAEALRVVCDAYPGAAAGLLAGIPARLALGVTPAAAWRPVLDDRALAPLARAMVRASRSGSSVSREVAALADDLDRGARLDVEERARAVGVKAAVPLGLCLLPSFLLIGVVPLVAGLVRSLGL